MRFWKMIFVVFFVIVSLSSCDTIHDGNGTGYNESDVVENLSGNIDNGPQKGGSIRLYSTIPDTLNPVLTHNVFVRDFSSLIFESLVKLDKKQRPEPLLAKSWNVSQDGLSWTFQLRDNVSWHDGKPFTSSDVEYTLNMIINESSNSPYKENFKNVSAFTSLDRHTFKIVLLKPDSFTAELMTFPILPKHNEINNNFLDLGQKLDLIGTGPYRHTADSNLELNLITNDNWWKKIVSDTEDEASPYLEKITVKFYTNETDSIEAFQRKETDIAYIFKGQYNKYNNSSELAIKKYVDNNFDFISFNLSNDVLKNNFIRKAILFALDRDSLVQEYLPGEAIVSDIPLIPGTWFNDTNITMHEGSFESAKELLINNGCVEKDGIMYINSKPLSLELMVNEENEVRMKVAKGIKKQLQPLGIDIVIKSVKWNEMMDQLEKGKYEIALLGLKISSIPDIAFMYSSYQNSGGMNIAGYINPKVDDYLEKINKEYDEDKKKAYYLNMRNIIAEDIPYIGMYFYYNAVVYNKNIRGKQEPYIWNRYNDISKWYLVE